MLTEVMDALRRTDGALSYHLMTSLGRGSAARPSLMTCMTLHLTLPRWHLPRKTLLMEALNISALVTEDLYVYGVLKPTTLGFEREL